MEVPVVVVDGCKLRIRMNLWESGSHEKYDRVGPFPRDLQGSAGLFGSLGERRRRPPKRRTKGEGALFFSSFPFFFLVLFFFQPN